MSLNRFNIGLLAALLCLVAVMVAMFSVPNVAPDAVVQATIEQVVSVQDPTPAPVPAHAAPVAPATEPVIAVPFARHSVMANITQAYEDSTLWAIAKQTCGDGKRWKDIMTLNGLSAPEQLKPGHVLIPGDCDPAKRAAPSKSIKVSPPASEHKASPPPVATAPKGPQAEVKPAPELPSVADMDAVPFYDCAKPRPTDATPGGRHFENWLAQCGQTFFTGPLVNEDVELYDAFGTITRTRVADYQIRQAEELKARLDYVYSRMSRNPDRFTADIEIIKAFYLECDPGIRNINQLSYEEAATTLVEIRHIAGMYSDSWLEKQRLQGAFLPLFWRQVFSYTVPAKNIAEPEENPVDALAAGS